MSNVSVVSELEQRFFPALEQIAKNITGQFPQIRVHIRSYAIGTQTTYQGHLLSLECSFSQPLPDQPDAIALSIGVRHLTTVPEINSADVCWSNGSIEADLLPLPVVFADDALHAIERQLPELYDALKIAIERGQPT